MNKLTCTYYGETLPGSIRQYCILSNIRYYKVGTQCSEGSYTYFTVKFVFYCRYEDNAVISNRARDWTSEPFQEGDDIQRDIYESVRAAQQTIVAEEPKKENGPKKFDDYAELNRPSISAWPWEL